MQLNSSQQLMRCRYDARDCKRMIAGMQMVLTPCGRRWLAKAGAVGL